MSLSSGQFARRPPGGVVEWLMAPVLKTGEVKASAGSNPAPSVYLTRFPCEVGGQAHPQASSSVDGDQQALTDVGELAITGWWLALFFD